ncbi:MAG: ABC transporter ATP-binding protein [Ruminiclostridium sp.]
MTVVSIEHLTKQYSNRRGIRGISFSIAEGQVLGLLGPNGSGKTTTMKVMTGLLKPDSGEVRLFGIDPLEDCPAVMAKTGCMIEQPGLYLYLTTEQNLRVVSRFYPNLAPGRVDEMLELVELSRYRNEKVQKFSMGMKQRLGFAMALLPNPELLILDEPTNGMDIGGTALVRDILKKETGKGCAILISSHLAHEMEQLCTHVAVMEEGAMLDSAPVEKLIKEHGSVEQYYLSITNQRKEKNR